MQVVPLPNTLMHERNPYDACMHGEWSGPRIAAAIAALKGAGISEQRIAKLAGVNRSTANRWARGTNRPDHDPVRRLAAAVWRGHPREARELVEASGYPWAEPEPIPEPAVPPEVLEVIRKAPRDEQWKRDAIEALEAIGRERLEGERSSQGQRAG